VASATPVNQLIYDALLLLQHRGQDAAGIVTQLDRKFFIHKAKGMVKDVFRTRNMRALPGNCGLGQVRYPTAGNAFSEEEAQPFYVNAPFGLVLVHNGNLTNAQALKSELFITDHRHINTESDSEVLLNVLAHELDRVSRGGKLKVEQVFEAVRQVHQRVRGSYAVIALIAGHGVLAFRDPYGIRPLCIGRGADGTLMLASESVALEGTGHVFERDVQPGEAVFIDLQGQMSSLQCAKKSSLHPCIFELGFRLDEERGKMRYVMRIAEFSESSTLRTHLARILVFGLVSRAQFVRGNHIIYPSGYVVSNGHVCPCGFVTTY